jgi:hypothetical protein
MDLLRGMRPIVEVFENTIFRCAFCLLIAELVGCEHPKTAQNASPTPNTSAETVSGQAFITTENASNLRLGSLKLIVIKQSIFDRQKAESQRIYSKRRDFLEIRLREIGRMHNLQEDEVGTLQRAYQTLLKEEGVIAGAFPAASVLRSDYEKLNEKWTSINERMDVIEAQISNLNVDYPQQERMILASLRELPEVVLDDLYEQLVPKAEGETSTDADGNFSYSSEASDPAVVAGKTSRSVGKEFERYHWFVPVERGHHEHTRILLSNNNLSKGDFLGEVDALSTHSEAAASSRLRNPRTLPTRLSHPQEPVWAQPKKFYLLQYLSFPTAAGISGWPPGKEVTLVEDKEGTMLVTDGEQKAAVKASQLTDNVQIAERVRQSDAGVQAQFEDYRRQQIEVSRSIQAALDQERADTMNRIDDERRRASALGGGQDSSEVRP